MEALHAILHGTLPLFWKMLGREADAVGFSEESKYEKYMNFAKPLAKGERICYNK
ncbi:MAG: hypothetical protein IIW36_00570 [Clostridia bacterium]|nr:hypothetical protein [Clostridia bacterium]